MKTCNMLLIAIAVFTVLSWYLSSLYAISHVILLYQEIIVSLNNREMWQNQQMVKCIALHFFPERQYEF